MKNITTCLWFDDNGEAAARHYLTIFENAAIKDIVRYPKSSEKVTGKSAGQVMTVDFRLEDLELTALNGGPLFDFNPSQSLFLSCATEGEISERWQQLSTGGEVRMGLDTYPWAKKYGWTSDRFGVEWQLILAPAPQKITPSILFTDALYGRGEEAIKLYTAIFPNSEIGVVNRDEKTNTIAHAYFTLNGQTFALMEGAGKHGHGFNESTSYVVPCETQADIDLYWSKLLEGGGRPSQCGWLKDKFGVSWQITPTEIFARHQNDPVRYDQLIAAMLDMVKIDLATLERAVQ